MPKLEVDEEQGYLGHSVTETAQFLMCYWSTNNTNNKFE